MLMYLIALCLVGWFVSRVIVAFRPKWWAVILAPVVSFAAVIAVGVGIMALELQRISAIEAVDRLVMSALAASIACIWSAIATYRRSRSGQTRPAEA